MIINEIKFAMLTVISIKKKRKYLLLHVTLNQIHFVFVELKFNTQHFNFNKLKLNVTL